MKDGEIRYHFLRDEKKFPVACIVSKYLENEKAIHFALSTHNPVDPYDKTRARQIALARLDAGKYARVRPDDVKNIKWDMMYQLLTGKLVLPFDDFSLSDEDWRLHIPERAREAARAWMDGFQVRQLASKKKKIA